MSIKRKTPADVARSLSARSRTSSATPNDRMSSFQRETFTMSRDEARDKAREWFAKFPKAAYMTEVESWRELEDGRIEFTMRRLPTAD
jgi:hypothetical protein